ncbi:MAG: tRNA pseudouridine(54/55) synthase Pus10 [Candidatus Lokiarchaeota archaeon]|nr:tRNA pseudouridine(54/55) synthase Pus10 [Candidatus Lokiarchaeota archaeon]
METQYSIFNTAKRIISDYTLCAECFGRQFALLGTGLSNQERANSILTTLLLEYNDLLNESQGNKDLFMKNLEKLQEIASKMNFKPAILLMKKFQPEWQDSTDKVCYLCNNFFQRVNSLVTTIINNAKDYEFENYLVGTSINAKIVDKEDEFRAKLEINTGESMKKNFNRVVGKKLEVIWGKFVEFKQPQLNIQISIDRDRYKVQVTSNPLCVKGRYRKLIRGIPQTHWPHKKCRGKGCEECYFTGKQYPTSVEELISPEFLQSSRSDQSVFHGAGREDIDARCIGPGRPFIIELKEPRIRSIDLHRIQKEVNKKNGDKVEIFDLVFVPRSEIKNLKQSGEATAKTYYVLIKSETKLTKRDFKCKLASIKKKILENPILQRTPLRVVHRRADLTRKRMVYDIEFKWKNRYYFSSRIKAMGGTYIKELISGDEGRTKPSLSELFGRNLRCAELDIVNIEYR